MQTYSIAAGLIIGVSAIAYFDKTEVKLEKQKTQDGTEVEVGPYESKEMKLKKNKN